METAPSDPCPMCGARAPFTAPCLKCGFEPSGFLEVSIEPAHAEGVSLVLARAGLSDLPGPIDLIHGLRRGPVEVGKGERVAKLSEIQSFLASNGITSRVLLADGSVAPPEALSPAPAPLLQVGALAAEPAVASATLDAASSGLVAGPAAADAAEASARPVPASRAHRYPASPAPRSYDGQSANAVVSVTLLFVIVAALGVLTWYMNRETFMVAQSSRTTSSSFVPKPPTAPLAAAEVRLPSLSSSDVPSAALQPVAPAEGRFGIAMEGAVYYGANVVVGFQVHTPEGPTGHRGDMTLVFDTGPVKVGILPANVVDSRALPGVVIYSYRFMVAPPPGEQRAKTVQVKLPPYTGEAARIH